MSDMQFYNLLAAIYMVALTLSKGSVLSAVIGGMVFVNLFVMPLLISMSR